MFVFAVPILIAIKMVLGRVRVRVPPIAFGVKTEASSRAALHPT
jgi:hypothetical protein